MRRSRWSCLGITANSMGIMRQKNPDSLLIGWTTVGSEGAATELARQLVEGELAVCTQVDGPIRSFYRWESAVCSDAEWRVAVKFLASRVAQLEAFIDRAHPYDTPEWVVVRPEHVAPKYLAWAMATK